METYKGDYRCRSSEGPEDPCPGVATQCWREHYTPSAIPVILCDECSEHARGFGYTFDQEATIQLVRDIEREAELLGV